MSGPCIIDKPKGHPIKVMINAPGVTKLAWVLFLEDSVGRHTDHVLLGFLSGNQAICIPLRFRLLCGQLANVEGTYGRQGHRCQEVAA